MTTPDERRRAEKALDKYETSGQFIPAMERLTIRQCLQERDPAGLIKALEKVSESGNEFTQARHAREALEEYRGTKEDTAEQDAIDNGQFGVGA